MPLLTPASVLIGVLLAERMAWMVFLVPWIFALMTFGGSLSTNFSDLRYVMTRPLPLIVCFGVLHLLLPLIAWSTGQLLYPGDIHTITGLVLAFVIPTGIMSFLWVSINRGNIPLTLALIVLDTVLSPLVVPYSIQFWVGAQIEFDSWEMMKGLLYMIVIPSLLGMAGNQWSKGKMKVKLSPIFSPLTKLGLIFVVSVNSAAVAPFFKDISLQLLSIVLTVFMIAACGYLAGFYVAKLFRWNTSTLVSLTFNSGMRNISAGVVIAIAYFPPAVSVPVIVGMLFQQFLASMYTLFIRRKMSSN